MPIPEARLKQEIIQRWDDSSETYYDHTGHGIKSEEERRAWMCAFKRTILPGTKYLLDAGCGTGELSLLMAEMRYRVTGLDLSQKILNRARIKAEKSCLDISFENIGHIDLLHIRDIQRRRMNFCDKIRRHSAYYMVFIDT